MSLLSEDCSQTIWQDTHSHSTVKRKELLFSVPYLLRVWHKDLQLSFWTLLTSGPVLIYLYSQAWTLRFRRSRFLTSCQTWCTWPQNMFFNHNPTIIFTAAPEYSRIEAPWNDPTLKGEVPVSRWGCWNLLMDLGIFVTLQWIAGKIPRCSNPFPQHQHHPIWLLIQSLEPLVRHIKTRIFILAKLPS